MSRPQNPALTLRSPTLWAIVALSVAVVAISAYVVAAWPRFTHVSLGGLGGSAVLSPDGLQWQSLRSTKLKTIDMPDGICPVAPPKILPAAGATGPQVYGLDPVHTTGLPALMGPGGAAYPVRFYINTSYQGPILVRVRSATTGAPVGMSPGSEGSYAQGSTVQPRPGARLVDDDGMRINDKSGQRNLPSYAELDIPARNAPRSGGAPGSIVIWTAYVKLAPGCYTMQIDGLGFSELMAFQVQSGQSVFGKGAG